MQEWKVTETDRPAEPMAFGEAVQDLDVRVFMQSVTTESGARQPCVASGSTSQEREASKECFFVRPLILEKMIGKGSYGAVYKVRRSGTNELYCAKVIKIPNNIGENENAKEARISAAIESEMALCHLDHKNIVSFMEINYEKLQSRIVVLMELVDGKTMFKFVDGKPLELGIVRKLAVQICSALAYIHSKRLIHRDISGNNILVAAQNLIKLIGFGLSARLHSSATRCIESREIPDGSTNFLAPERLGHEAESDEDSGFCSSKSDIWSFGCVVYLMATGGIPYSNYKSLWEILLAIGGEGAPQIQDRGCAALKDFYELCTKNISNERKSAEELLQHEFLREVPATQPDSDEANNDDQDNDEAPRKEQQDPGSSGNGRSFGPHSAATGSEGTRPAGTQAPATEAAEAECQGSQDAAGGNHETPSAPAVAEASKLQSGEDYLEDRALCDYQKRGCKPHGDVCDVHAESSASEDSDGEPVAPTVDDFYPVTKPHQGFCIIINVKNYQCSPAAASSFETRTGSERDVARVREVFEKLKFTVTIKEDLTTEEICDFLFQIKMSRTALESHRCFVCFLMAHGTNDCIYGSDGQPCSIKTLAEFFKPHLCGALASKPKIFFIQACRGSCLDPSPDPQSKDRKDPGPAPVKNPLFCPNELDFLFCYATTEGAPAYRNEEWGSTFVQTLCDIIENNYRRLHLLDIMTKVNDSGSSAPVGIGNDFYHVVFEQRQTLRKKVCLDPNGPRLGRSRRSKSSARP